LKKFSYLYKMKIKALEHIKPEDIIIIEDSDDHNHSIVTVFSVYPDGLVIKEFGDKMYCPSDDKRIVVLGNAKHKLMISLLNKSMDRRISKQ